MDMYINCLLMKEIIEEYSGRTWNEQSFDDIMKDMNIVINKIKINSKICIGMGKSSHN